MIEWGEAQPDEPPALTKCGLVAVKRFTHYEAAAITVPLRIESTITSRLERAGKQPVVSM